MVNQYTIVDKDLILIKIILFLSVKRRKDSTYF